VTNRAIVDAVERIVFAGVAITTRALSEARADLDLTALISQLPILAAVRRIDIATVVRERAT